MRFLAYATSMILCLGCASSRPKSSIYQRQAAFQETEYAPYAVAGSSTITGQAFLKTLGGDVKYGAGSTVVLIPITSYSREWFGIRILRDIAMSSADERAEAFTKPTLANGEGRFKFERLPAGDYYAVCYVKWSVPSLGAGLEPTGGWAFARAHVDSGGTVDVVVTRPDYSTVSRMQGSGTGDTGPLSTPFTVVLEDGSRIGATRVRYRSDGILELKTIPGDTQYLNAALVKIVLDSNGRDWTRDVLTNRRVLTVE